MNNHSIEHQQQGNKKARLAAICMVISAVSFFAFLLENIFVALTDGYIDNRNMVLPFILGYGLGMAAVYLILGTPQAPRFFGIKLRPKRLFLKHLYYFATVFICLSIAENAVGQIVETVCDVTWWDYTRLPLHITKFTSIPTSTAFTVLIMLFMHFCFEPLYRKFLALDRRWLYPLAIVLMLLLFADCIFCGVRMYLTHDFMTLWKITLFVF